MLMAGQDQPVLVVLPPARQDSNNDLDDELPMDEDECLDYADQDPLSEVCHSLLQLESWD